MSSSVSATHLPVPRINLLIHLLNEAYSSSEHREEPKQSESARKKRSERTFQQAQTQPIGHASAKGTPQLRFHRFPQTGTWTTNSNFSAGIGRLTKPPSLSPSPKAEPDQANRPTTAEHRAKPPPGPSAATTAGSRKPGSRPTNRRRFPPHAVANRGGPQLSSCSRPRRQTRRQSHPHAVGRPTALKPGRSPNVG